MSTSSDQSVILRGLAPGDMGWMIERHGYVYAEEFGWNTDFEALVARIVADYHENFRPGLENAWIAELEGQRVGCVLCCHQDAETAKLRILLVDPAARGHRLGERLVDECITFATEAGYRTLQLWTNDILVAARRIYQGRGFHLVEEEPHHSFGHDLVGQIWERGLDTVHLDPAKR